MLSLHPDTIIFTTSLPYTLTAPLCLKKRWSHETPNCIHGKVHSTLVVTRTLQLVQRLCYSHAMAVFLVLVNTFEAMSKENLYMIGFGNTTARNLVNVVTPIFRYSFQLKLLPQRSIEHYHCDSLPFPVGSCKDSSEEMPHNLL
jgi:hypothetical protein